MVKPEVERLHSAKYTQIYLKNYNLIKKIFVHLIISFLMNFSLTSLNGWSWTLVEFRTRDLWARNPRE